MLQIDTTAFDAEVLKSNMPVMVMFYADWCSKCAMMKPLAEALEDKYGRDYKFCKVNIEKAPALAEKYETDIVPAFLFFIDGEPIAGFSGLVDETVFEARLKDIFKNY